MVASFRQSYSSAAVRDTGKKTLFLKRDRSYNWRIVAEEWSKAGIGTEAGDPPPFLPSMRFFKTDNPSRIMGQLTARPGPGGD